MRRFELEEGTAKKFWEVSTDGASLTVHFGRIGTDGQSKKKHLGTPEAARDELDKLMREKTKKGYVEVTTGKPAAPPAAPVKRARRTQHTAPRSQAFASSPRASIARAICN